MTILTKQPLQKMEEYYFGSGYKNWCPFPEELKAKLLNDFGKEPLPYSWSEQDILEGSRKIITTYFKNHTT